MLIVLHVQWTLNVHGLYRSPPRSCHSPPRGGSRGGLRGLQPSPPPPLWEGENAENTLFIMYIFKLSRCAMSPWTPYWLILTDNPPFRKIFDPPLPPTQSTPPSTLSLTTSCITMYFREVNCFLLNRRKKAWCSNARRVPPVWQPPDECFLYYWRSNVYLWGSSISS